jgi:general secretion pathway protein M
MTPAILQRLSPGRRRALAVALLVAAVALVLAALLAPLWLLHRHYDDAIESWSQRLSTYQRVAAQAPELTRALDAMRARDGRRYFLRNTAANLAGAELQEIVKAAIEGNGGRITTSQSPAPRDDAGFRQIVASVQFFASVPSLQKILGALETGVPLLVIENVTIRPANAFRGFKPAPGQEPEANVQIEVAAWAFPETAAAAPAQVPSAARRKPG